MGFLHDADAYVGRKPSGSGGRPAKSRIEILHARIVWEVWSILEGGENAISDRHSLNRSKRVDSLGLRQDEIVRLREGKLTLSASRREQLKMIHPGLAPVMAWPMGLLSPTTIQTRRLEELIAPFLTKGPAFPTYAFPDDPLSDRPRSKGLISYQDSERLYERGDPMGFFALVETYRARALERDTDAQWFAALYMISALPGLCRHPAVKPHAAAVIHQTKYLLRFLPDACWPIRLNENVIYQQIASPVYEPSRVERINRAKRGDPVPEPDAPYIHYRLVRCHSRQSPIIPSLA
ncbi:hypothetical protein [Xanthomonas medicagonis]|uniref:hypothetical protein n=1 Tax=Xanthomonas medicagonis TaxID=3160841 RepID=UPI0035142475